VHASEDGGTGGDGGRGGKRRKLLPVEDRFLHLDEMERFVRQAEMAAERDADSAEQDDEDESGGPALPTHHCGNSQTYVFLEQGFCPAVEPVFPAPSTINRGVPFHSGWRSFSSSTRMSRRVEARFKWALAPCAIFATGTCR
jgi:hypothetical protein